MIIGLAILAGIGYLLLQENKKKTAGTGLPLPLPQQQLEIIPGANETLFPGFSGGEFDRDLVEDELESIGLRGDDIDQFYEWLDQRQRSSAEIYRYLQNLVASRGLYGSGNQLYEV